MMIPTIPSVVSMTKILTHRCTHSSYISYYSKITHSHSLSNAHIQVLLLSVTGLTCSQDSMLWCILCNCSLCLCSELRAHCSRPGTKGESWCPGEERETSNSVQNKPVSCMEALLLCVEACMFPTHNTVLVVSVVLGCWEHWGCWSWSCLWCWGYCWCWGCCWYWGC